MEQRERKFFATNHQASFSQQQQSFFNMSVQQQKQFSLQQFSLQQSSLQKKKIQLKHSLLNETKNKFIHKKQQLLKLKEYSQSLAELFLQNHRQRQFKQSDSLSLPKIDNTHLSSQQESNLVNLLQQFKQHGSFLQQHYTQPPEPDTSHNQNTQQNINPQEKKTVYVSFDISSIGLNNLDFKIVGSLPNVDLAKTDRINILEEIKIYQKLLSGNISLQLKHQPIPFNNFAIKKYELIQIRDEHYLKLKKVLRKMFNNCKIFVHPMMEKLFQSQKQKNSKQSTSPNFTPSQMIELAQKALNAYLSRTQLHKSLVQQFSSAITILALECEDQQQILKIIFKTVGQIADDQYAPWLYDKKMAKQKIKNFLSCMQDFLNSGTFSKAQDNIEDLDKKKNSKVLQIYQEALSKYYEVQNLKTQKLTDLLFKFEK